MAKETTGKSGTARRSATRRAKPADSAESAKPKKPGRLRSGVRTAAASTRKATNKGLERLTELADHPLVSELIAVGAMAAVAAIADQFDGKNRPTARHVKAAARAAATAMGTHLLTELTPGAKKKG